MVEGHLSQTSPQDHTVVHPILFIVCAPAILSSYKIRNVPPVFMNNFYEIKMIDFINLSSPLKLQISQKCH